MQAMRLVSRVGPGFGHIFLPCFRSSPILFAWSRPTSRRSGLERESDAAGQGEPTRRSCSYRHVFLFFVFGLLTGTRGERIPAIKNTTGLSDGGLGFALLAAPLGVVIAM